MQIIRSLKDRSNPYVQINKKLFEDPLLSLKAKGFVGYCLSKPDNWIFHVDQLCTVLKEKERALYNIIKECIDHGYAIRWRKRLSDGRFDSWQTIISDSKEEILRVRNELNSDTNIQKSFTINNDLDAERSTTCDQCLKKCLPHRCFADLDNPHLEKSNLNKNDKNKNEDIIAREPEPPKSDPPPKPKSMPAGGNNNFFKCLEKCEDLSDKQKRLLMKYPEPLVEQAVRYCYHPTTQIKGGPIGRIKLLQYFLQNPDDFKEKLDNLDKPPEKLSKKDTLVGRFKRGEVYNGYEFLQDDIGVGFYKAGMMQPYSVRHDSRTFAQEFLELLKKLKLD